jgi:hypothetical protein
MPLTIVPTTSTLYSSITAHKSILIKYISFLNIMPVDKQNIKVISFFIFTRRTVQTERKKKILSVLSLLILFNSNTKKSKNKVLQT